MNIITFSDLHLTDKKPKSRLDDDYFETMIGKLTQIYDYAQVNGIYNVLQTGDFFDSHNASDFIKQRVIAFLLKYAPIFTYTIYGQHDQRFHSSCLDNTPLKVLESSQVLDILQPKKAYVLSDGECQVHIYGAGWNQEPAELVLSAAPDITTILVTHRMVINDKLWEAQEDFTYAKNMFRKFKHDFIITGDNHQHFVSSVSPTDWAKRHLINGGSIMRSNITQIHHEPCFYVIDTRLHTIKRILLDVETSENVLAITEAEEKQKTNADLLAFIETMQEKGDKTGVTHFVEALKNQMKHAPIEVQKEVEHVLELIK